MLGKAGVPTGHVVLRITPSGLSTFGSPCGAGIEHGSVVGGVTTSGGERATVEVSVVGGTGSGAAVVVVDRSDPSVDVVLTELAVVLVDEVADGEQAASMMAAITITVCLSTARQ